MKKVNEEVVYKLLHKIPRSPSYKQDQRYELLSHCHHVGPPHLFLTFIGNTSNSRLLNHLKEAQYHRDPHVLDADKRDGRLPHERDVLLTILSLKHPSGNSRQSQFGPSNWKPRGGQNQRFNNNQQFGGSSSSSFQSHRPPPNPNFSSQH